MRIAVDTCVGNDGIAVLLDAGHEVLNALHGERDRDWLALAARWGANLYVSPDADVQIYAYDINVPCVRQRRGETGTDLARRVLRVAEALVGAKP